jgi:hypothetical protein
MTSATATPDVETTTGGTAASTPWPLGDVLRDISRGGIAGLIVGLVVGGLGGRIAMRLSALAVPAATGSFTENGNRIGTITLGGSLGLIIGVGLIASLFLATIWVTISPWLPGPSLVKGLLAAPIAVAFGSAGLIDGNNLDFVVLRHDPVVVGILLTTVALTAPAMAVTDAWLDRRLPAPGSSTSRAGTAYALLSTIGAFVGGILMLQAVASQESRPLGLTIIAVGIITIGWWRRRVAGLAEPPRTFVVLARSILVVGTVAGFIVLWPAIRTVLLLRY